MKEYLGDILMYNRKRQLVLVVVTATQRRKSREWVIEYRRNLYVNAELPKTPFFAMVLPDHFYLWKDVEEDEGMVNPTYEMNPRFTLEGLFNKSRLSLDKMRRHTFEFIVNGWFGMLQIVDDKMEICSQHTDWQLEHNQAWLFESGLFETIKKGHMVTRYEYDNSVR
jgi:hypothetical protein